jgi:hypothetical protein
MYHSHTLSPIIDMHCHSTNSDGAQTPEEMYAYAKSKNIGVFAITDHDIVTRSPDVSTGWDAKSGQYILHGAEVSVHHRDGDYERSLHIPIYALTLSSQVDDLLSGIRDGKMSKILRQCDHLRHHGCQII